MCFFFAHMLHCSLMTIIISWQRFSQNSGLMIPYVLLFFLCDCVGNLLVVVFTQENSICYINRYVSRFYFVKTMPILCLSSFINYLFQGDVCCLTGSTKYSWWSQWNYFLGQNSQLSFPGSELGNSICNNFSSLWLKPCHYLDVFRWV